MTPKPTRNKKKRDKKGKKKKTPQSVPPKLQNKKNVLCKQKKGMM